LSSPLPQSVGPVGRPRLLFLNRSYWPDAEATGQLLTELCEDLAGAFDVAVIAGQPNQNPGGAPYRRIGTELRRGVRIHRVIHTRLPKRWLLGRVVNLVTYLGAAFLVALRQPRPSIVVVETDPPLLALLGKFLKHWHRCRLLVYLQDIYPDVAVALGRLPPGGVSHWLRAVLFGAYRGADRVVVLSRDMRTLLANARVPADRIACIPNWADTRRLIPIKRENDFRARHGLNDAFVVMYSGNIGLSQRLELLIDAAAELAERRDIVFLLIGAGASKPALQERVVRRGLRNVRLFDYQPPGRLATSLSAADLHVVPLDARLVHCLMPSKLYAVLACGTAVLAIAPPSSELGQIVRNQRAGLVVAPGDVAAIRDAIAWCADHRDEMRRMGEAGRAYAVAHCDRRRMTQRFSVLLSNLVAARKDQRCAG
jgi:colanic acid biosynthesis glycosyl transferase WcaI